MPALTKWALMSNGCAASLWECLGPAGVGGLAILGDLLGLLESLEVGFGAPPEGAAPPEGFGSADGASGGVFG